MGDILVGKIGQSSLTCESKRVEGGFHGQCRDATDTAQVRDGVPLVRLSKHELAAIYMDQGLRHLTLDRFDGAEREFKQVLEYEPTNNIAWYNLACTYSRWGKLDQAFGHL